LANVKALFQNDDAVAAGWLHYLAFDLFVGAYVVRESQKLGISRWIFTLILPFTFMFGPVGYLIFFITKTVKTKSIADIHS
jgi:TRAP-type C4-dicarboxylate transport system permease small subunit